MSKVPATDPPTLVALTVSLVIRPLAYTLVDPQSIIAPIDGSLGRRPWWLFHAWILLFQWIPFSIAWWALARGRRPWSNYGVDWSWFRRRLPDLATGGGILCVLAIGAPHYWYGGSPPATSKTLELLPVSSMERLFFLICSASAGICEETCYRGLPLRGAVSSITGAVFMLPAMIVSFVFVHGWFGWDHFGLYASAGLVFGVAFIAMGRRRLEWLMVLHALIDAGLGVAP